MTVKFRNYTSKAGFTDDYHKIRNFLIRINRENVTTPNFLWGRWEWMFSSPYLDKLSLSKIGIWEADDDIISIVTYESNLGKAFTALMITIIILKKRCWNMQK